MHVCNNKYKAGVKCVHSYCNDCYSVLSTKTIDTLSREGRQRRPVNFNANQDADTPKKRSGKVTLPIGKQIESD
jgi:hypothetical protein